MAMLTASVTGFGMIFYKPVGYASTAELTLQHKGLYKFATAAPYGLFKTWIGVSEGECSIATRADDRSSSTARTLRIATYA